MLSGMLIYSLIGCGQKQKEVTQPETDTTVATVSPEEETIVIPVVMNNQRETQKLEDSKDKENTSMKLYFNETEIPVEWENCKAVEELMEEAAKDDIVVSMSMYGGWEQVGFLGKSYTRDDKQMTAVSGDIVLYSGNQIVVFYGSNSWSYTKLGRMDLSQDTIEELLSNGDIKLTIRK